VPGEARTGGVVPALTLNGMLTNSVNNDATYRYILLAPLQQWSTPFPLGQGTMPTDPTNDEPRDSNGYPTPDWVIGSTADWVIGSTTDTASSNASPVFTFCTIKIQRRPWPN
jgi:hypothetical protein